MSKLLKHLLYFRLENFYFQGLQTIRRELVIEYHLVYLFSTEQIISVSLFHLRLRCAKQLLEQTAFRLRHNSYGSRNSKTKPQFTKNLSTEQKHFPLQTLKLLWHLRLKAWTDVSGIVNGSFAFTSRKSLLKQSKVMTVWFVAEAKRSKH